MTLGIPRMADELFVAYIDLFNSSGLSVVVVKALRDVAASSAPAGQLEQLKLFVFV